MHPKMKIVACEYLDPVFHPERRRDRIARIVAGIGYRSFDAIAFCGMSGALVAPTVADALGKTLLMVRKSSDNCHSGMGIEGDYGAQAYVILDDVVSSGATVRHIARTIQAKMPTAKCVGIYTYLTNGWADDWMLDIREFQSSEAKTFAVAGMAAVGTDVSPGIGLSASDVTGVPLSAFFVPASRNS